MIQGKSQSRRPCRFRRNFKPYPWVRVPLVSWQLTSPSVITLEYLPGMKITDVARLKASGRPPATSQFNKCKLPRCWDGTGLMKPLESCLRCFRSVQARMWSCMSRARAALTAKG